MESENLTKLLVDEIKDLYSAENQLIKALPKMAKAASSPELKKAFESHLKETKNQIARLEKMAQLLDEKPKGPKCKAMEGLLEEGSELMDEEEDPELLDAGLICAAQKVEHYEIASYGTLKAWADLLELEDVAALVEETLNEEKAADVKLTTLAMETVNIEAMANEAE